MSSPDAELLHSIAKHAMEPMRRAIVELRNHGFDELATELTAVRERWARTVVKHVTAQSLAPAPVPTALVIALPQKPASRPRAPVRMTPSPRRKEAP